MINVEEENIKWSVENEFNVTRRVMYGRRKDGERRRSDCLNRNGGVQETPLVLDG